MAQAKEVYELICCALDAREWTYETDAERLLVKLDVHGEDLMMKVTFVVDEQRGVMSVLSPMPTHFSVEKRVEGALAVCGVTYKLPIGGFDYDIESGRVAFRANMYFEDGTIGVGKIQQLLSFSLQVIDEYNDKFLAFDKGYLSLEDLVR